MNEELTNKKKGE